VVGNLIIFQVSEHHQAKERGGKKRKAFLSAVFEEKHRESRNLLYYRRTCCEVEKREKRSYFQKERQTFLGNEEGKKNKRFSLAK